MIKSRSNTRNIEFDRNVGRHSYLELLRDYLPEMLENVDLT